MVLQKAQVKIINDTVCDEITEGQVTSRMLCSGYLTGGVDACQVRMHARARARAHTITKNTCIYFLHIFVYT